MKIKRSIPTLLALYLLAIVSCATFVYSMISKTGEVPYAADLKGKSLSIVPFVIEFATDNPISIEGMKINGEYVSRYAYQSTDGNNNKFGGMRLNLFKKAKVDAVYLQNESVKMMTALMSGNKDYTAGFFAGFGEGKSGVLSNRPIDYDRDVYPKEMFFKDTPLPSYYASVKTILNVKSAKTDLVMTGKIRINSEIRQYIDAPMFSGLEVIGTPPGQGDYAIYVYATIEFEIVDIKTGKTVVTQKTKFPYPMNMIHERLYSMQIKNKALYENIENFDKLDYTSQALTTVEIMLNKATPYFTPFYVNYEHAEEVKK